MPTLRIALIAAAIAALVLPIGVCAQLSLEWSLDLSHLPGEFGIHDPRVAIDREGNVYIAYNDNGVGVIKIRPDESIAYQTVYPCTESALELHVGPHGEVYVLASQEAAGITDHIKVLYFNSTGTFAWEYTWGTPRVYITPHPTDVDHAGNFWLGVMEFVYDAPCIDSVGQILLMKGTAGGMSIVNTYRGDHLNGGTYPRDGGMFTDALGNVNLLISESGICYDPTCDPDSAIPLCYVDHNGDSTIYWNQLRIRKHSSGGGLVSETTLYTSDNPSDKEDSQHSIFGDQQGGVIAVSTYRPDPEVWTVWRTTVAYNGWKITLPNRQESGVVADYNNDLYIATINVDGSKGTGYEVPIMYKLSGINGSVLWTGDGWEHQLGIDLENNIYTTPGKVAPDGTVQWNWPNLGYAGSIATFVGIDNQHNHFHFDANNKTLYKFVEDFTLTVNDALGEPMADTEFELVKLTNTAPVFNEESLGKVTTDVDGEIKFDVGTDSDWQIITTDGTVQLNNGDLIKLTKHLHSKPAVKHPEMLATAYSIHIDHAKFDEAGAVSFYEIGSDDETTLTMDHTEVRFNLVVGIEWDATQEYLQAQQATWRAVSNYLYDVTDGQARLDTIAIYDDLPNFIHSDVRIYASNVRWPVAHVEGIELDWPYPARLPRMFMAREVGGITDSCYARHPLHFVHDNDLRTKGHEMGHYLFGFWDEYKFVDPFNGVWLESDARCGPRPEFNYGMMDREWFDAEGGERASEMSSASRYIMACRNTEHWYKVGMSGWDYFEARFEGTYGPNNIRAEIIKPGEAGRTLPEGLDYLPGPNNNNYLTPPDYDVGALMTFPVTPSSPDPNIVTLHAFVKAPTGNGAEHVHVLLTNEANNRRIKQGKTTGYGNIYVLGADYLGYKVESGTLRIETELSTALSQTVSETWLYGAASSGGSGISRAGNRYQVSTAADSLTLDLRAVSGLPAVVRNELNETGMVFHLDVAQPFSQNPTLEIANDTGMLIYEFVPEVTGYSVAFTDSAGASGDGTIWCVDQTDTAFFFNTSWVNFEIDSASTGTSLVGPDGDMMVAWDSLVPVGGKSLVLSSQYPVPRDGLAADAVRAGQVHTISWIPDSLISVPARLTIRYTGDLNVGNGYVGDESTLQVYRWDEIGREWSLVGGVVDTEEHYVAAGITGPGVYAAFTTNIITDVEDDELGGVLPYLFELSQNYPNPFNPATTIKYSLQRLSSVRIDVFNLLGQKVQTLVNREQPAGSYSIIWDGRNTAGEAVSTGVYFYRFQAGDHVETKKMLLLK